VDLGREAGQPVSPLLTPTRDAPKIDLVEQFTRQSSDLDPAVRDFVIGKLKDLTSRSA